MPNDKVKEAAKNHAETCGSEVTLIHNYGWVCYNCDDDYEEAIYLDGIKAGRAVEVF